jgi:hypothetical protein
MFPEGAKENQSFAFFIPGAHRNISAAPFLYPENSGLAGIIQFCARADGNRIPFSICPGTPEA